MRTIQHKNCSTRRKSFLATENKRSRRHKILMRIMLEINSPVHYNQDHSTQIFRNAYYQHTERRLFNRNTYAPPSPAPFEPSEPPSNKSETSSSGASQYVLVNSQNSVFPTYDPTWPTYQSSDFS